MRRSMIPLILGTLSLAAQPSRAALNKYWVASADWSSPSNWLDGLLPETDTRVVFPAEARHAVGLPANADLRLAGIELPRNGIVALPETGKLTVSETPKSRVRKSHWLREAPFFWQDPLNWNGSCEAAPHLERLPCQGDLVVLPGSSRTFSVRLPTTRDVEVRAVRIADDNETLARWEWRDMADRAEFIGPRFSVKYNPLLECENCQCQEGDLTAYAEEICSIQRPRCGLPACEYPLKVEGHCCYYCGGRIRLSKKTLLGTVQRLARKALKGYEDRLFWHSRLTWDENVEVLVTEKGAYEGTNVIIATARLHSALQDEDVEVLYSETSGGPLYDYRLAVALGPFLGGLLVLLLLILILCPMFGYSLRQVWETCQDIVAAIFIDSYVKKGKKKSFAFARFENVSEGAIQLTEDEEVEVEEVEEVEEVGNAEDVQAASRERFENPLYRLEGQSRNEKSHQEETTINFSEPVSLVALKKTTDESHQMEELDIEHFS